MGEKYKAVGTTAGGGVIGAVAGAGATAALGNGGLAITGTAVAVSAPVTIAVGAIIGALVFGAFAVGKLKRKE